MLRTVPVATGGTGEASAIVFLGTIDDRAFGGETDHAGQTERATRHGLSQPLQAPLVVVRQEDAVIDAEARVGPGPHLVDCSLVDLAGGEKQVEDFVLPGGEEWLLVDLRHAEEVAIGGEGAAWTAFET